MNGQLGMFEPEGVVLAELVRVHCSVAETEQRRADNLALSGFRSAARSRLDIAKEATAKAFQCEMALHFESLAGLV